jgi:NAD(P)H-dependent flavin oxidoreductase YrpB (nitropropane dioxygenase family)
MLTEDQRNAVVAALCVAGLVFAAFFGANAGGTSQPPQKTEKIEPPKDYLREEPKGDQTKTADANKPAVSAVEIKCDPNCEAQQSDNIVDTGQFPAFLRKLEEDPIEIITAIIALANVALVGLIVIRIRDSVPLPRDNCALIFFWKRHLHRRAE